jgi:hypothetical protein
MQLELAGRGGGWVAGETRPSFYFLLLFCASCHTDTIVTYLTAEALLVITLVFVPAVKMKGVYTCKDFRR